MNKTLKNVEENKSASRIDEFSLETMKKFIKEQYNQLFYKNYDKKALFQ